MSVNRENVVWKTRDNTWSIGFFDFWQTGDDYEWDVEYDHSTFNWCSTGHATKDEAEAAWRGANPGGSTVYFEPDSETDKFDQMAAAWKAEQAKRRTTFCR